MIDTQSIQDRLDHDHGDVLDDDRYVAEGLDRAVCSPLRKHLAQLAAGAACHGESADGWRAWVRADAGEEGQVLLDSAEECMRASGLWPWPEEDR